MPFSKIVEESLNKKRTRNNLPTNLHSNHLDDNDVNLMKI